MAWTEEMMVSFKSIRIRQALHQTLSLGIIVTSALMIWKGLMCITGTESPVIVVLTGSMEPGFGRGDILFLQMSKDTIRVGEIVVYNIIGRDIPIVHRVIKVHEQRGKEEVDILTKRTKRFEQLHDDTKCGHFKELRWKHLRFYQIFQYLILGDNNLRDDISLYDGELWLQRHHIMGRAFLTICWVCNNHFADKPIIKYVLIGVLGFLVIVSKD